MYGHTTLPDYLEEEPMTKRVRIMHILWDDSWIESVGSGTA